MSAAYDRVTVAVAAKAASICRCGSHAEIGHAKVQIGAVTISVAFTTDGIRWPDAVTMTEQMKAEIGPGIEQEFLRIVAETWAGKRLRAGCRR